MKTDLTAKLTAVALAAALTALSSAAFAQKSAGGGSGDGVVTLDQAKAAAGNVTPGDAAGFPITLSQPGHYRLTGNLTLTDPSLAAIQVMAPNVRLDLNGFTIKGPNQCEWVAKSCQFVNSSGIGIYSMYPNTEIVGGTVEGFANVAVMMHSGAVRNVRVQHSLFGLYAHNSVEVEGVHATLNQYSGVQAGAMSMVRHSRAARNFGSGFALSGGLLQSSMAEGNAGHGINAAGVYVTGVRESVFNSNGLGDIGGAASMGNNLCTGKLAC